MTVPNARAALALAIAALAGPALAAGPAAGPEAVAAAALKAIPVWDGHNDVPGQLRDRHRNVIAGFDFSDTTATADPARNLIAMQTDLKRLRQGRVGAQFWSVYVSASLPEPQAVQATLEQIDVTKRLIAANSKDLQYCTDSACVEAAMKQGRIASLLGMEGGHSIGGSLAVLRQMHTLGARYMTLTHSKNNGWADASTDKPVHNGLSPLGKDVVREMQRLGMLVDLSHVSEKTMMDALDVAGAPVIFSHSNARALNGHPRNVPDSVLARMKANGGIVMVNFYPPFVNRPTWEWQARRAAEKGRIDVVFNGNPQGATGALAAWEKANPAPRGGISDVADHLDHIRKLAGVDHVGLGGDFDGIDTAVEGLDDVSTYPALFTELARRGWSQADLEKLAGRNMLRVLKAAEAFAASQRGKPAYENPTTF